MRTLQDFAQDLLERMGADAWVEMIAGALGDNPRDWWQPLNVKTDDLPYYSIPAWRDESPDPDCDVCDDGHVPRDMGDGFIDFDRCECTRPRWFVLPDGWEWSMLSGCFNSGDVVYVMPHFEQGWVMHVIGYEVKQYPTAPAAFRAAIDYIERQADDN